MFEHGQIVRINYAVSEYWIEMLVIAKTEKKYRTAMHRKSHRGVECSSEWKIDSLESYAHLVGDLRLSTCSVPS